MKRFLNVSTAVGLGVVIAATAGFAASHSTAADQAVAARHSQMQLQGYYTGILGAIAKGEMEYDSATVDAAASNLRVLAGMQRNSTWIEGTEQGAVEGSRAKAEIWSDPDGFAKRFTDLENASAAMIGAADAAAVGAGMQAIGASCSGCHDNYRGPKN